MGWLRAGGAGRKIAFCFLLCAFGPHSLCCGAVVLYGVVHQTQLYWTPPPPPRPVLNFFFRKEEVQPPHGQPPPDQSDQWAKTKFTVGKILLGHFWYTNFLGPRPPPPSLLLLFGTPPPPTRGGIFRKTLPVVCVFGGGGGYS